MDEPYSKHNTPLIIYSLFCFIVCDVIVKYEIGQIDG